MYSDLSSENQMCCHLEGTASLKDYLDIFDAASEKIRSNTSSVSKDGRMTLEHRQVTGE